MQRSSDYNTTRKISWIERMNREVYRMFLIHLPTPRFLIDFWIYAEVGVRKSALFSSFNFRFVGLYLIPSLQIYSHQALTTMIFASTICGLVLGHLWFMLASMVLPPKCCGTYRSRKKILHMVKHGV
ncbi:hypothetical protein LINGRAHAP2_LOCUS2842 [Linum grandiflorum]